MKLATSDNFDRDFLKNQEDLEERIKELVQNADGKPAVGEKQIREIARMVLPLVPQSK